MHNIIIKHTHKKKKSYAGVVAFRIGNKNKPTCPGFKDEQILYTKTRRIRQALCVDWRRTQRDQTPDIKCCFLQ
jgi:hypothetical protein